MAILASVLPTETQMPIYLNSEMYSTLLIVQHI
jgi:hypothetical protein